MRISHQLVPNGGWKYRQDTTILRGQTWNELLTNVITHRVSNGIPLGDVADEIDEQIADENPSIIINGYKSKKKPMGVSFFHTVKSFAQFLLNWTLSGGKLVDQNTANIRGDICVGCHNNKKSSEVRVGCSTCNKLGNATLNSIRSTIIKNNKASCHSRLLTCGICGCDNQISVWIPNEILLNKEDANAYPSFCWKKAVLEGRDL